MGFKEAVRTCLQEKYATFSGRASRSEYWYFSLFYVLVLLAFSAVAAIAVAIGGNSQGPGGLAWVVFGLMGIFMLAMFLPSLSVYVRRFHDRNLSGWWILGIIIGGAIPFVGFLISIAGLVILVLKGTEGPNRFGDDPLNPSNAADVFA